MPPTMSTRWVTRKSTKIGVRTSTDSRTPRMFRIGQADDEEDLDRQLLALPGDRQEAEQRVARRRDRHGDGQHIVDEQRRARDDPDGAPKELGRHHVAAAAMGELLDDAAVGGGDEDDREGGHRRDREREVAVLPERPERLLGAVRRRRQPVGPEADPREDGDEREALEEPRVGQVAGPAEHELLQPGAEWPARAGRILLRVPVWLRTGWIHCLVPPPPGAEYRPVPAQGTDRGSPR